MVRKTRHLIEATRKTSRTLRSLLAVTALLSSASSIADSSSTTSGIGIRLTIIPATNTLHSAPQNPFSTIESALASNQLNQLELNSTLLTDFSMKSESGKNESPTELVNRLEQALEDIVLDSAASSSDNNPVVFTVSAG